MHRKSVTFLGSNSNDSSITKEVKNDSKLEGSINKIAFHSLLNPLLMYIQGLTSDTKKVMFQGLCSLVLFELTYSYMWVGSSQKRKKEKREKKEKATNYTVLLFGSTLISLLLSAMVFVLLVLLGAPLASHINETILLACHLSMLVLFPVLVEFKFDYEAIVSFLMSENAIWSILSNQVLCSGLCALVGVWIGVIPIPLDWDRPWQKWPITLLLGAYSGSFIGSLLVFFLFYLE